MSKRIANPWHEPGKGSVGPFYEVPDEPFQRGEGLAFYRTRAGSVLVVDADGRAINEVAGLTSPAAYIASTAHRLYRYVYPPNGGPPTWAFNVGGA